jgi:hypothetical protein
MRVVAGALALVADVTIYLNRGRHPRRLPDGVFKVVELGTDTEFTERIDRLMDGLLYLAAASPAVPIRRVIDADPHGFDDFVAVTTSRWERVRESNAFDRPDLVVVADFTQSGATRMARTRWPDVPIVVIPLLVAGTISILPRFAGVFDGVSLALAFTEDERDEIAQVTDVPVQTVPLPMAANPSVTRSPHEQLGEREYVAVVTEAPLDSETWRAQEAKLLVARFPHLTFAVCAPDRLTVFEQGRSWSADPPGRGSDLSRVLAWATFAVDLCPGRLVARRCLESLLYGTPILVPAQTRAEGHARRGRCGLWFEGVGELLVTASALSERTRQAIFAEQGTHYLQDRCLSTDEVVNRILSWMRPLAVGFMSDSVADHSSNLGRAGQ